MVPTLKDGDVLLVRGGARTRPGDVVVGVFRSMPARYVVKRAGRPLGTGWELISDNPFGGGDSSSLGVADVLGRAVLRWPRGALLPRRLAPAQPRSER
jgi:hypothetical protein